MNKPSADRIIAAALALYQRVQARDEALAVPIEFERRSGCAVHDMIARDEAVMMACLKQVAGPDYFRDFRVHSVVARDPIVLWLGGIT